MKKNYIAQDDNQNRGLKIDEAYDHPMIEITSHTLSTLGSKALGQPEAQDWLLP
jgi:hypothetical protein